MANYTIHCFNKKSVLYKHEDFYYQRNSKNEKAHYLRCSLYLKNNCKGTAKLIFAEDLIEKNEEHNHGPEEYPSNIDLKLRLKHVAVEKPNEPLRHLFNEVTRSDENGVNITYP